ncbi:MAG: hypothetical protein AAGF30_15955 [Pseudomonadota bacterium]
MTAPDTNVKKQARRHRPALYGITIAILAAVAVFFLASLIPEGDVMVEPEETVDRTDQ